MSQGPLNPKTQKFLFPGADWLLQCPPIFSVLFFLKSIAELSKDKYSNYRQNRELLEAGVEF